MAKKLRVINPGQVGKRKCGGCTGCCITPTLTAPPVKGFEQCSEMCNTSKKRGCGIYDERPQGCRDYSCHWLINGFLERQHRPDKIGIIFDDGVLRQKLALIPIQSAFGLDVPPITVREIWRGAFGRNRQLLNALSKRFVLILIAADTTTSEHNEILAPSQKMVDAVKEALGIS